MALFLWENNSSLLTRCRRFQFSKSELTGLLCIL